jgi:hypothetical protein
MNNCDYEIREKDHGPFKWDEWSSEEINDKLEELEERVYQIDSQIAAKSDEFFSWKGRAEWAKSMTQKDIRAGKKEEKERKDRAALIYSDFPHDDDDKLLQFLALIHDVVLLPMGGRMSEEQLNVSKSVSRFLADEAQDLADDDLIKSPKE